ncbi:MAG TPA: DHA2 family efflux MFS transporter permease subunit [Acidimicrobiales bacterium]|nr:DHA2 family efflux MFS transporter permease subunit [Acidimicrobiales bacterium]
MKAATEQEIYDRRWWILSVLCLSLVMIIVGNTVLNVTLPTLIRELDASNTELQWIVDIYGLVFAGLLLTAGALGDRFGRKGALTAGLVVFGLGSAMSAFATEPVHLVVTRAIMGLGAAFVMPATLSILTTVFPPQERARAIAVWAGLAGAGAAIGPIAGGWLLRHFWWGSVFLVNIPVIVIALVAGHFLVPTSKDPRSLPLDPVGAALSILGLGSLLYAIIEAPVHGWTAPVTLTAGTLAVLFLAAFGVWELRARYPMLDLRLFRNPRLSAAAAAITLVFFAMFGTFFLFTQYLQLVMGYDALGAGLRTLPVALTLMVFAPLSARFVERFGARLVVATGLTIVAVGLLLLTRCGVDTGYGRLAVALIVLAIGMATSMAPSTASIMSAIPPGKAGVGSALNDTTRELGGALGVAVLGSLVASRYASGLAGAVQGLPAPAAAMARSSLGGALQVAAKLGPIRGPALADAAKVAFVDGLGIALFVGAGVALVAAALVGRFLPAGAPVHAHGKSDAVITPLPAEPPVTPAMEA